MVLTEKDIIKEVDGKHLALIMNRLWRIDLYAMTISIDYSYFLSNFISIISRVQFQVFSGVTLELIKLI